MSRAVNKLFNENEAFVHDICNKLSVHMTFGEWLRDRLNARQMTNADLARLTELSPTYIGHLVRDFSPNTKSGRVRPSEETVAAIAVALSVTVDEARRAAGYAPTHSGDSHDLDGIYVSFDGADDLSDDERSELLRAVTLIAEGIRARKSAR